MSNPALSLIVLGIAAAAAVTDLRSRRIPNVLTFGAAGCAFVYQSFAGGMIAIAWAVAGWVLGTLLFLPLFALRGMGAGDVKLLAAIGAWLGPVLVLWVAIWTSIVGGVLAVAVALARGYLGSAFRNLFAMIAFWRASGFQPLPSLTVQSAGTPRLAYAVPMLIGTVVTLWMQ